MNFKCAKIRNKLDSDSVFEALHAPNSTRKALRAAFATLGSGSLVKRSSVASVPGSPISAMICNTGSKCSRRSKASCSNGSAFAPAFTKHIPAMVDTFSSREPKATIRRRPTERSPVACHMALAIKTPKVAPSCIELRAAPARCAPARSRGRGYGNGRTKLVTRSLQSGDR